MGRKYSVLMYSCTRVHLCKLVFILVFILIAVTGQAAMLVLYL